MSPALSFAPAPKFDWSWFEACAALPAAKPEFRLMLSWFEIVHGSSIADARNNSIRQ
jgi:hypothetical protein